MKRFTFLISILLTANVLLAQWIQQNPNYPDTLSLLDIFFIDEMTGWTNGEYSDGPTGYNIGNYHYTYDGGSTWNDSLMYLFMPMHALCFTDHNHGWGVGDIGSVWITSDGGINWIDNSIDTQYDLTSVFFIDALTGWTIGTIPSGVGWYDCKIFHTIDGGQTWERQDSWGVGYSFGPASDLFINENDGWTVTGNTLKSSVDGGESWSVLAYLDFYGHSLSVIDENNLWIAGINDMYEYGVISNSNDGGTSWINQLGDSIPPLNDVLFVDPNLGWAVGDNGTILHTQDGGDNWVYQESGTQADLHSLSFADENHGWICGDSSIILYTDNGGTVGIKDSYESQIQFKIFPNPTNDKIIIDLTLESEQKAVLMLTNTSAQILKKVDLGNVEVDTYELNCAELLPGIYFVTLRTGKGAYTEKLIIRQ